MPPRSQLLTHTGSLAIGMIVGSLATAVLLPAVPTSSKPAPKAEKPATKAAPPAAPAVVQAALKAEKPATKAAPPAALTVAKAEERKAAPLSPSPPEFAPLGAQADKKADPEAAKPKPEDILANNGLKRSGQVYILKADEDFRKNRDVLMLSYDTELGPIQSQLFRLATDYRAQQESLYALQQKRSVVEGLIAQADMNRNGPQQPVPNAPFGQQPVPNAPFVQQPVPDAPFGQQPVPNAPFGQQPGNDGRLGPDEGNVKKKGAEQEPKKLTRSQLADQLAEIDEYIIQSEYKMFQLEREYKALFFKADRIVSALEGNEALLYIKSNDIKKQYDELRKDPLVTMALAELNKNPGPRLVLGPVEDRWVNLKKLHDDLLRSKGLVPARHKRAGGNGDAKGLEASSKASDKALTEALKKQKQERAEAIFRQKRLAEWPTVDANLNREIAKARTPVENLESKAKRKNAKDGIEKDLQKENQAEEIRKKRSQEVAVKRKAFVEEVAALDRAVEDPVVKQAINFKELKRYLAAAKKRIRTEQIKLDPDKAMFWVDVFLNENKESTPMVIDPALDEIRLSESFAAKLGIRPLDTDPRIDVAVGNGQAFSATRITLKAVRVGSFKVNDVECLVFSKGFDGQPQLGASFLDNFVFELDPGAARLTLTKVD